MHLSVEPTPQSGSREAVAFQASSSQSYVVYVVAALLNNWRPLLAMAFCTVFYWPSLRFGFYYDDFWILQQSWSTADPMHLARPAWLLSTIGLARISTDPFVQRLASLICFNLVAVVGFRLVRPTAHPLLLLLVLLSHPWFVYPVTWISQRADLLWLVFVILALITRNAVTSTVWGVLSLLAKTPFILHAIVLARRLWLQKRIALSAVILLAFAAVAAASYFLVLGQHVISDQHAAGGFHSIKHSFSSPWALFGALLLAGAAKIGESLVLMFVPFPATYGTGILFWATGIGYFLAWGGAFWILMRRRFAGVNGLWLLLGASAALSFVFTAQLRAIAPAGFFIVAALLAGLPATGRGTVVLAVLLGLNVLSSVALYPATDTGCYDLHQPGAYEACREGPQLPYRHWSAYRHQKTDEIAEVLKGFLDAR